MYTIKKDGCYFLVVTASGGVVQFRSTRRANAAGWIADNSPSQ